MSYYIFSEKKKRNFLIKSGKIEKSNLSALATEEMKSVYLRYEITVDV